MPRPGGWKNQHDDFLDAWIYYKGKVAEYQKDGIDEGDIVVD